jgi:hypothetical protein
MAHFYGKIQGSRGATSRCGTKHSGMSVHVGGWNIGIRVGLECVDGVDFVRVYRTNSAVGMDEVLIYEGSINERARQVAS